MKSRFAALKTSCATLWYSGLNTNALVVEKVGKLLDLSEIPECEVDQAGHIVEAEAQVLSKLIVQAMMSIVYDNAIIPIIFYIIFIFIIIQAET